MSTTLVVLLPLLLAPIVLLLAFAGCESFGTAVPEEQPPEKPTDPPVKPAPSQVYATTVRQTNGLVAHWRLDEASGTTLVDSGPDAATMKFSGEYKVPGELFNGQPGALSANDTPNRAVQFLASGGYAEVPVDPRLNPLPSLSFSVEAWFRPDDDTGGEQTIVSSRQFVGGGWRGYELLVDDGVFVGRTFARGTDARTEVRLALDPADGAAGAWRHVVLVYRAGKLTLVVRVKGGPAPRTAESDPPDEVYDNGVQSPLRIGAGHVRNSPEAAAFLNGWLDEVAFYNVALTPSVIGQHYAAAL